MLLLIHWSPLGVQLISGSEVVVRCFTFVLPLHIVEDLVQDFHPLVETMLLVMTNPVKKTYLNKVSLLYLLLATPDYEY